MITQVTQGIKISVSTHFQESYSKPDSRYFLFSYKISIENTSEYAVKLLRRHWSIFDSSGDKREVEGEGVVGQQPVLEPGEVYEYESACNLTTDMGKMKGIYLMERKLDKARIIVNIPEFQLITPQRLN